MEIMDRCDDPNNFDEFGYPVQYPTNPYFPPGIYILGGFTFWQKCEFYKVHLICSAYNLSIDGNEN